jgi:hypothetical protein
VLSLGLWKLNATVAEHFVRGRVLLCGDAAHQFPPTGGLGVNTGLQGMHNAMWKLAWFLRGWAGWPLVETYEAERRGVAQRITSQSLQNSINVAMITAAAAQGASAPISAEQAVAESRRYGNHLGVEFGVVYQSRAVVPDGTQAAARRGRLHGLRALGHAGEHGRRTCGSAPATRACRRSTSSAAASRCSRGRQARRGAPPPKT